MRLALSSRAAPDLPLAALLEGCRRRGLAALELVPGHAHGVAPGMESVDAVLRATEDAAVPPAALDLSDGDVDAEAWMALAATLCVPAIVPVDGGKPSIPVDRLRQWCDRGGRVLLPHRSDPDAAAALREVAEALPDGAAGLAWEVDPAADDAERVPAVLEAAGSALAYVRLRGGGPESIEQTGQGVGVLMARLALSRYGGPLVLAPSTPRYLHAWRAWLGRAGGWGCGSKQSDPSLVTLSRGAGE